MQRARSAGIPMAGVVAGLVAWSAWFSIRSSFEVDGQRYFALFDDAMISMVYARNFVEGHGLNWARWGDPVEGFTCPLWTFLMIPVNALPLPLRLRSLAVQGLSLALLCASLFVVRRLVLAHFTTATARSWLPAVVLTAAYFPLNHWSLMGMETALQSLWNLLAVHLTLQIAHAGSQRVGALFAVLTAAILTRMDMALLAAACLGYLAFAARPPPLRRWLPGAALSLAVLGAYQVFRMSYFGDPLPNTFYLKMTGTAAHVRIARGLVLFLEFARPLMLAGIAVCGAAWFLRRARPQVRLPLAVVALDFLYAIYIGGDVYDFFASAGRFVAPAMPLAFVVAGGVWNDVVARLPAPWREPRAFRYATAAFTLVGVLVANGLLDVQSKGQWQTFLVIERPLFVDKHPLLVARTLRLQQLLEPDARLAVSWAGLPAYFSDFPLVDFLGYNDRRIARMPAVARLRLDDHARFDPGHLKWDVAYVVDELKPDAIYLDGSMRGALARGAKGYALVEEVFWLRRGSDKLRDPASIPELSRAPERAAR